MKSKSNQSSRKSGILAVHVNRIAVLVRDAPSENLLEPGANPGKSEGAVNVILSVYKIFFWVFGTGLSYLWPLTTSLVIRSSKTKCSKDLFPFRTRNTHGTPGSSFVSAFLLILAIH